MTMNYSEGARVASLDGTDLGTVLRSDDDGIEIQVAGSSRTMRIPYDVIATEASSENRVIVQGAVAEGVLDEEPTGPVSDVGDHTTLSLAAEEAIASVRDVDRGKVIIDKHVEMFPHEAKVDIGTDRVDVERVPVNEEFDSPPGPRQEGDTLIVPVVEEVLVVTKRYRVVEEVHVHKYRDVETQTLQEELRREVVDVREVDAAGEDVVR